MKKKRERSSRLLRLFSLQGSIHPYVPLSFQPRVGPPASAKYARKNVLAGRVQATYDPGRRWLCSDKGKDDTDSYDVAVWTPMLQIYIFTPHLHCHAGEIPFPPSGARTSKASVELPFRCFSWYKEKLAREKLARLHGGRWSKAAGHLPLALTAADEFRLLGIRQWQLGRGPLKPSMYRP